MKKKMINLTIDGIKVSVEEGSTILTAARKAGVEIPTLCYLEKINAIGACRMCLVEVKGMRGLVASCVYPVAEGMEVTTNSDRVIKSRKTNLELILSNHRISCSNCLKSKDCKLKKYAELYLCNEKEFAGKQSKVHADATNCIVRDSSKCILCQKCRAVCQAQQAVGVININNRGFNAYVGCAFNQPLNKSACVGCGQCTLVCPTGALTERDEVDKVISALANPELTVVVSPAPSVRVTLGEEFGLPIGSDVEGKLVSALRRLGFKYIFDVDFAADMTIMEEGYEFIDRLSNNKNLPLITSCSPGWVNFMSAYYPDMMDNMSTAKSPMQMQGAMTKTYWAEKMNIDPSKIFTVHIMPCTAKKSEVDFKSDALAAKGIKDTDVVLTVRELARLIKMKGIDFKSLPDGQFDKPLGESTGAAVIFGTTGGVMEAALRTVAEVLTKKPLENINFKIVRGTKGIKEATINVAGKEVNICVTSGLANAKVVLDNIRSGKKHYHFVEIMCCPGGCVNGGGTPYNDYEKMSREEIIKLRAKALYKNDANKQLRKSHENPDVIKAYKEYFEKPNSHKAHEILHRKYIKKEYF